MSQPSTGHVFMSYSRKDDAVMQRIVIFLRKQGIKVWVDNEKLIPGTPIWEEEIEKAIKSAPAMIAVLSPDSKNSEWVRREISVADQHRKRVFPVLVSGDEETSITLRLTNRQFVDIRKDETAGLKSLCASLALYLENLDSQEQKPSESIDPPAAQTREKDNRLHEAKENLALKNAEIYLPKLKIPALILVITLIGYLLWQGISSLKLATPASAVTEIPQATFTTNPPTETIIPTPTRGIGSTMIGTDGATLVYVPKGEFTMGSNADDALAECKKFGAGCQRDWFTNEEPPHAVSLEAFWVDKTEVTNAMYAKCVNDGGCKVPTNVSSETHPSYYGNSEFDNYPVIYVDWNMAGAYCSWAKRRLPSEAEWEKAARGTNALTYPWGNTLDGTALNFCDANCAYDWANKSFNDGYADVAPVGNYPSGQSIYGALDLAGNVWEWVNDWYDVYPGSQMSIASEFKQKYRILRGGSWYYSDVNARSAYRLSNAPDNTFDNVGFRCAR